MYCQNKLIDAIPIIECIPDQSIPYHGVFFFIHGHTGSKDLCHFKTLAERITNLGFWVITIDAFKHGERIEEPYISKDSIAVTEAMMTVVLKTADDLQYLFNNYYRDKGGKLGVLGISMGGHIAYQMVKRLPSIDLLIPLIGAPDLRRHYHDSKQSILGQIRLNQLEDLFLQSEIPYESFEHVHHGIIMVGADDQIVNPNNAQDYYHELTKHGYSQLTFQSFPVGHAVTSEMEDEIECYIKNAL